jgi:YgiT-type zinc finger domain-containing protein
MSEICALCQGRMTEQLVTYSQFINGQFVIVENVPALVCEQCGDRLYSPDVVERLQELIWSQAKPVRTVTVPVYDLERAA